MTPAQQKEKIYSDYASQIKAAHAAIKSYRFIWQREDELMRLGYTIEERRMGSGGVRTVRQVGDEIRIQIGYGHTKHNYAKCVVFSV